MRRGVAILFAIWATAACAAVDGNATAPTAAPSPGTVAAASPTPTPSPIATRIAWPPMADAPSDGTVTALPGIAASVAAPPLVPAGKELAEVAQGFATQFAPHFFESLQNIRDFKFHGSEPYMFTSMFGRSAFADGVRDMLQTGHTDQTRRLVLRSASLDRGWRGQNGVLLVEGTLVFDDEVGMPEAHWYEGHTWAIRGLGQAGSFFVVDGAEIGATTLGPVAGFDIQRLDAEVARQVVTHLSEEQASTSGGRPVSPYNGTAYWDARKAALDQLFNLAERGVLTDRHFEGITAQVTEFSPTSYLGDGIVTVRLRGTLVEVMRGVRHAYPVDERVRFQRSAFAQPWWLAVDGDDGTGWLMHGDYSAAPISLGHG
jgi:hypothetical protein